MSTFEITFTLICAGTIAVVELWALSQREHLREKLGYREVHTNELERLVKNKIKELRDADTPSEVHILLTELEMGTNTARKYYDGLIAGVDG